MYSVYWIHKLEHIDPYTEGYVGVSKNVPQRILQHRSTRNTILYNVFKNTEVIIDILQTDLESDVAYMLEQVYRPKSKIGWNICEGGGRPPCANGINHHNYGRKHSMETRKKLSLLKTGSNNHNYGKQLNENVRHKISASQKGILNHRYGKTNSIESNIARSLKLKNISKQVVTCPHCYKNGGKPAMVRFHFDNCKIKRGII